MPMCHERNGVGLPLSISSVETGSAASCNTVTGEG
jgi:hypothetical protein